MSAATSPRPQAGLAAFKEQNGLDPYLPSSPDDEQLTQVSTSHNTPSSVQPNAADSNHFLSASTSGTGESPYSEYFTNVTNELSPSDYQDFQNLDDLGSFDDDKFYGTLPAPEDVSDFHSGSGPFASNEPLSATSLTGTTFSRRSTGMNDFTKELLSPVPTDAASPQSIMDGGPVKRHRLLGGGEMSRSASQSTAVGSQHELEQYDMRPTPALTRASVTVSPDPNSHGFPSTTPALIVDQFSRGDSPARSQHMKRSRASSRSSSHLRAPPTNSGEEEHEEDEDDERYGTTASRHGIDPSTREDLRDEETLNADDLGNNEKLKEKKNEIGMWLRSSANTGLAPPPDLDVPEEFISRRSAAGRIRSKSTSNPNDLHREAPLFNRGVHAENAARLIGPNVLIDEDSEEDYSDEESLYGSSLGAAPPSINMDAERLENLDSFPVFQEPKPQEPAPWSDPIYFPSHYDSQEQPGTANAAMMRFQRRAKDIDTASRVATWGTQPRRKSDGEMERIFGAGGLLARLSISKDRTDIDEANWRQFKETLEQATAKLIPRRTLSSSRRKQSTAARPGSSHTVPSPEQQYQQFRKDSASAVEKQKESFGHERHSSVGSPGFMSRMASVKKRPKSPGINTNVSGIAQGLVGAAHIGGLGSVSGPRSPSISSPKGPWEKIKHTLSRHSSQDDHDIGFSHHSQSTNQSKASLVSPPLDMQPPTSAPRQTEEEDADADADADAESDEIAPEDTTKGVKMDIKPSGEMIIPNFEGFKVHVRDTNPRLPNWLVERLGQEQLRRYKKLVAFKVDHAKARETGECQSGAYCRDGKKDITYFPAKASQKEPEHSHTGFHMNSTEDDEDTEAIAEGLVQEAQFTPGLPLPPAKRLPAEFECPLCFQVKKFTKPSDWSKHVHEDLQPFTCTFSSCPDPKSFKRKADWVRHENERHRQLEWWQCSEEGCQHLCYRRDNFVQHLVREHKLPEPKSRNPKPNRPAVRGPAKGKVKLPLGNANSVPLEDKVLFMVEACRHETNKSAMEEPCRFCGNVLGSFKKLTVHLARHMESLSLPVLKLVEAKDVTPDTIISPIDIKLSQPSVSPIEQPQGHSPIPGFTPISNGTFDGTYPAPGIWNPNPQMGTPHHHHHQQQQPQQGNGAYDNAIGDGWIPDGIYNTGANPGYHIMMQQHHNSVPNPAIYNMSGQGSGMSPAYGMPTNYTAAAQHQQNNQAPPHFHTPQYNGARHAQNHHHHMNVNASMGPSAAAAVPTSQPLPGGEALIEAQYQHAYTQAQNAAGLYGNASPQPQRGSPQHPQQGFYNVY